MEKLFFKGHRIPENIINYSLLVKKSSSKNSIFIVPIEVICENYFSKSNITHKRPPNIFRRTFEKYKYFREKGPHSVGWALEEIS